VLGSQTDVNGDYCSTGASDTRGRITVCHVQSGF
jgi:hypothetical protein